MKLHDQSYFRAFEPGYSCVKLHFEQIDFIINTCVFPVAVKTRCTLEKLFFFFFMSLIYNQWYDGKWAVLKVAGH